MPLNSGSLFSRIYTSISGLAIKNNKRCHYFLSYLKLRTIANKTGGRFYLKDAIKVLGLSERTTKKHLANIKEVTKTKTGYRIDFPTELRKNKKSTFVLISNEKLFSYSWKNIASFHAYLSEIEFSRYERHKQAKTKGYKVFNEKDKIFERIQDGKNSQYHNLLSIKCGSLIVKKSNQTICRYKKLQNVSKYESKKVFDFEPKYYNKNGEFIFKKFESENKGKFCYFTNPLYFKESFFFSPIRKRNSELIIKFG